MEGMIPFLNPASGRPSTWAFLLPIELNLVLSVVPREEKGIASLKDLVIIREDRDRPRSIFSAYTLVR